jgi:predicted nuclease of predicted toxin-antitoxin system
VRLLLDEQLSAVIASALRDRGHDVIAVQDPDRTDWRGLDDAALFQVAQDHGRAIVTDNVVHFRALAQRCLDEGRGHFGVLYLNNASLPRHRHDLFVSQVIERLEQVLAHHPGNDPASIEDFV